MKYMAVRPDWIVLSIPYYIMAILSYMTTLSPRVYTVGYIFAAHMIAANLFVNVILCAMFSTPCREAFRQLLAGKKEACQESRASTSTGQVSG